MADLFEEYRLGPGWDEIFAELSNNSSSSLLGGWGMLSRIAEWWVGRWTAFDPTNGVPVGEQHVVVGRGREYGDVPPLKGVYAGPKSTGQGVEVTITRLR